MNCPDCNRVMITLNTYTPNSEWRCEYCNARWKKVCDKCLSARHNTADCDYESPEDRAERAYKNSQEMQALNARLKAKGIVK